MTLLLRMDDKMNRQLSSTILKTDHALALAEELVHYGFINEVISFSLIFKSYFLIAWLFNGMVSFCNLFNSSISFKMMNKNN